MSPRQAARHRLPRPAGEDSQSARPTRAARTARCRNDGAGDEDNHDDGDSDGDKDENGARDHTPPRSSSKPPPDVPLRFSPDVPLQWHTWPCPPAPASSARSSQPFRLVSTSSLVCTLTDAPHSTRRRRGVAPSAPQQPTTTCHAPAVACPCPPARDSLACLSPAILPSRGHEVAVGFRVGRGRGKRQHVDPEVTQHTGMTMSPASFAAAWPALVGHCECAHPRCVRRACAPGVWVSVVSNII